ncbi:hypothetical protein [Actinotalea fermentans]|nr:hypothetical protein [Actinotalea fermentans]KGM16556.1 hypothetical protein N867_18865 [Actinotalea fermentans ATCC 43279 = JCM 9966 = DSM 3133]
MADQPPSPPGPPQPQDQPPTPSAPMPAPAPGAPAPMPMPAPAPAPMQAPAGYYPQQPYYAPGWTQAQTQPQRHRGRKIALFATLAVVVLGVLGTVTAAGLYWWGTQPIGDVTSPTSATARQVRAGHCIRDLPADGSVGSVTLVPCSDDHEAEVLGSLRLDDGPWPGDDGAAEAAAWCEMDNDHAAAGYRPVVWTPSRQSWTQGDRVALCIAWLDD